jgi:uncharacterized protein YjbI with pentapeptide repeats
MTRPIPPELLARIQAHERWVETFQEEGQQFAQQRVDLRDMDLSGRDLSTVALSRVCFDKALLYATDLSVAILIEGSFVQAIMDNALLIDADATGSNFSGASLRRVQGISTELMKSNLRNANLEESNFNDADFQKANLEGANFSHANLRGAYLVKAHLAHAILTGALVEKATFIGATGIETVEVEWIDIGSEKAPQRLESAQAKKRLLNAAAGRAEWKITA